MYRNLVRVLFPAIILVTMLAMPAYSADPASDNPPKKAGAGIEQKELTGDPIKHIQNQIEEINTKLNKLTVDAEDSRKKLATTESKVDAKGMFLQLYATVGVAALAILFIVTIGVFAKTPRFRKIEGSLRKLEKQSEKKPPAIIDVKPQPCEGHLWGGEIIRISGTDFDDNTQVWIGEQRARIKTIAIGESGWVIAAETPPFDLKDEEKRVDVKVETARGTDIRRNYFRYHWPLLDVSKNITISSGGGQYPVNGMGFGRMTKVKAGTQEIPTEYLSSEWLLVNFPPGKSGETVPVDICREDGKVKLMRCSYK
jgi:hypothetical protein